MNPRVRERARLYLGPPSRVLLHSASLFPARVEELSGFLRLPLPPLRGKCHVGDGQLLDHPQ